MNRQSAGVSGSAQEEAPVRFNVGFESDERKQAEESFDEKSSAQQINLEQL